MFGGLRLVRVRIVRIVRVLLFVSLSIPLLLLIPHHQQIIKLKDVNQQVGQFEKDLKEQINSNKLLINSLRSLKKQSNGGDGGTEMDSLSNSIAVLLFSCNRVTVRRNLDQLIKHRPDSISFPIIVSQDCGHEPTRKVLQSYGDQITLIRHPDLSDIPLTGKEKKFKGYYKISRHYAWALNQTFNTFNYNTVIIVEDDLDIAPDFFEYFKATYPLLVADSTLWCVSAWNDNGKEGLIAENSGTNISQYEIHLCPFFLFTFSSILSKSLITFFSG